MMEAVVNFGLIIIMAAILVFVVMASQFESLIDPFIVILTIPLSFIGVVAIYALTGNQLNIVTIMGMLVLVGTIVNNGIVLVDYTNLLRKRGFELEEACVQAARNRLRPILMSTLTTVISLMPMAFFPGEGSASMQPISLTVFGGMTFGSVMTLFLMPTVYFIVNNRRLKKAAKKKAKKLAREEAKKGNVRKTRGKKFDVALTTTEGEEVRIATDGGEGDLNPEEKKLSTVHIEMQDEKPQDDSEAESTGEVKKPARKPRARKQTEAQEQSAAEEAAPQKPKRTTRKRTAKPKAEDVAAAEEQSENEWQRKRLMSKRSLTSSAFV